jgi:cytochrome c oxidase assembly protein subunit 15
MAVGTPVIATGTGGSAEYLKAGRNALLAAPGDAEALARAVRRLAADGALRARLAAGGRRTAEAHPAERGTAVVARVLQEAVAGRPAPAPPPGPGRARSGSGSGPWATRRRRLRHTERVAMRSRSLVTPQRYAWIAYAALALLTLIVFTGAAVRLTGSGWAARPGPSARTPPSARRCAPTRASSSATGLLTGLVGLPCILAFVGARLRAPYRRDFFLLGFGLCLSVLAQAVLGGITVRTGLNPWTVMAHYLLSMVALVIAVVLAWRVYREQRGEEAPIEHPGRLVLAIRALIAYGAVVIAVGTASSACRPPRRRRGTGDEVVRPELPGRRHARLPHHGPRPPGRGLRRPHRRGVAVGAPARRPGLQRPLAITAILLAVQGVVGNVQYHLELPAELVWIHVALAAVTWNVMVWAVLAAGRPAGTQAPAPAESPQPRATVGV